MKLNLSKKLAISVLLLSLGLSQVACQSQSSKDDMFNQVGQSQEADKENRQNLKALEDFVGLKDIDSIKITLDDWIGGHDPKKNDILVLERTLDIKSKSQVLAFADIFMGVGKKDLKGDENYKEVLSHKKDIVNRLKLSPEKAMIDSYIKDIKENKHGNYKDTTIKGNVEPKSSISFKSKSGNQVDFVLENALGRDLLLVNKKGRIYELSYLDLNYIIYTMMDSHDKGPLSKDLDKYVRDKGDYIKYRISHVDVKIPNKLEEPTYGDRFKLYLAYVNDLLKKTGFKEGLDPYLGQDLSFERYRLNKESQKRPSEEESYLIAIFSGDKLVGAYKDFYGYAKSFDGKTLEDLLKIEYRTWVKTKMVHDKEAAELEKLGDKGIISKFVELQNSRDKRQKGLMLPDYRDGYSKMFKSMHDVEDGYIDNVLSAKLLSIRPDERKFEVGLNTIDKAYMVEVDYRFKEVIVIENGVDEKSYEMINLGPGLGYRIYQMGY
ncbi:MAG: hypothetical protein HXL17_07095 [Peptostreptococcus sp.]|uniref:hypothetical protein n=1 Tax=Peptostreptococcus sp. TaxID=1262 RepID=UPI001CB52099|nr:hypothetical protein [Peptostreptococcus sp.]MBF1057846.1 hypothetical protein [Peptostreptococcus sp.]